MFTHATSGVAVLFDLDGTLVDSQDAETLALQRLATQLGGEISTDEIAHLAAGRRMQEAIDMLCAYIDVIPPVNALPRARLLAEELLEGRLCCVPGVDEALQRSEYPNFVVSNSPLDMIGDRLSRTGLLQHFPGPHFSAYEFHTWKPAPDLYLAAVDGLGLDPDAVIAVEDSMVGVQAAIAAGLRVYWYRSDFVGEARWDDSVRVFGEMSALPEMLAQDLSSVGEVVYG
ncbi:HAD family phosphatase [Mycobacterium barrassiae]|uniref:HAD family hydrolase n=1 Tax=Mycobacterium barrassiae TaxID=319709 RepID=UPI002265C5D5|nr:HAD family phosphatase [Mycobacterium barrassiae]MCV7302605.1 HAD family phosphatase [Mycobacterium barrassiae]